MSYTTRLLTFLLLAGLVAGCEPTGSGPPMTPEGAAAKREKASTEMKEAAVAFRDYAYAEKALFVGGMKEKMAEIQADVARLSDRVARASGEAKTQAETTLAAVRTKWAEAQLRLDAAEKASESEWETVKGGFGKAYEDLRTSSDEARRWVRETLDL